MVLFRCPLDGAPLKLFPDRCYAECQEPGHGNAIWTYEELDLIREETER